MLWIEITATVFGFLCVVLTIRRNIWCWPVGLVQVLLFIVIFYDARLYSDLILHVIYVGMQLYGWYCWRTPPGESRDGSLQVSALGTRPLAVWVLVTALGTFAWGYGMQRWTNAAVPYGDAFTTVASLVAQYLLARKKLDSWLFWIAVDVTAIAIYLHKSLIPTTVLYTTFLGLAIIGFVAWRRQLDRAESAA